MKIITLCLFFIIRIFISLILIVNCTGSSLGDVLHATNKDEVINPQNDLINSHKKHYSNLKDGNVLEDSLSCHYPFSHLYRWPIEETSYEIACTQEVEAFEFGDFYTGEEITINEQTGVLTIFPNENPIDIMKVIVVYSKEVVFQFSISIDGNNDMIIPGLHYNYTSYSQYNCHDSFINPEIPIIDNIYTPSFYGYKDINDISILFPNLNFIIPFTFYLSWNMTITEDNDYIFYISNYDTVELYIDDIKVIYEYKICSKEIFTINGTIHLNKGNHQVLAFTESYSDSYNNYIYLIYYGKVNTPIDRFPLPTTYYDNNFKPVLELTSDKYYYSLELNSYVRINLYVNEGNRIKCSCLEQLPNGLNFNFDYTKIEGIPTIIQEVELYHISCRNVYSITNYIEISIEIKGGYRNGLLAYYTKAKVNFDEECKTIYDIVDDNNNEEKGEILVSRHEYSLNHSVTTIGRFSDLPIDMNGEFSLIMNGFIRFRRKGNYSLKITNSDTFLLKIGRGINIFNAKCQNIANSIYYYYIKDGLYPFVLKYTNNYFIPHIDIDIELYGNEVRYDLYYSINYYYYYLFCI